jgi:hypothetical protein
VRLWYSSSFATWLVLANAYAGQVLRVWSFHAPLMCRSCNWLSCISCMVIPAGCRRFNFVFFVILVWLSSVGRGFGRRKIGRGGEPKEVFVSLSVCLSVCVRQYLVLGGEANGIWRYGCDEGEGDEEWKGEWCVSYAAEVPEEAGSVYGSCDGFEESG